MGKKLNSNPKAVEARERKETVKQEKQEKEKKAKEDAQWVETDKHVLGKEERKRQQEEKKHQEAERKKANRDALAQEDQALTKAYAKNLPVPKVTQAEIAKRKQIEELAAKKREDQDKQEELQLQENINRVIALEREEHGQNYVEARSLDDAVGHMAALGLTTPDKKPKVTYAAYEEKNLPDLRAENPTLKLSQVKELMWKQWQKSPENPMNQLQ